jgi:hypothetical protein
MKQQHVKVVSDAPYNPPEDDLELPSSSSSSPWTRSKAVNYYYNNYKDNNDDDVNVIPQYYCGSPLLSKRLVHKCVVSILLCFVVPVVALVVVFGHAQRLATASSSSALVSVANPSNHSLAADDFVFGVASLRAAGN